MGGRLGLAAFAKARIGRRTKECHPRGESVCVTCSTRKTRVLSSTSQYLGNAQQWCMDLDGLSLSQSKIQADFECNSTQIYVNNP